MHRTKFRETQTTELVHFFLKIFENRQLRVLKCVTVSKNVKGGPLGFFNIHPVANIKKIVGEPFGAIQKFLKKVS